MDNRVKYIDVSEQVLADILKMAVKNAIPKDSKIMRMERNNLNFCFRLFIHSKKFDKVPEGALIPKHGDPVISSGMLQ